jgi:hypothetical protein
MLMPEPMPAEPTAPAGGVLTESILGLGVSQAIYVAAVLGGSPTYWSRAAIRESAGSD